MGEGDAARSDLKAGDLLAADARIDVAERDPFVSRGGHKLAAALDAFGIDPAGLVCLDVGASTGGFTDALLQRGATRVYAVDVGRGQLAESLRRDERVVSMERTNARSLTAATFPESIDLAVVDVSFISVGLVLGPIASTLRPGAARRDRRPREAAVRGGPRADGTRRRPRPGGPPRSPRPRRRRLRRRSGWARMAVIASPILGPEGNREFLVELHAGAGCANITELIAEVALP